MPKAESLISREGCRAMLECSAAGRGLLSSSKVSVLNYSFLKLQNRARPPRVATSKGMRVYPTSQDSKQLASLRSTRCRISIGDCIGRIPGQLWRNHIRINRPDRPVFKIVDQLQILFLTHIACPDD